MAALPMLKGDAQKLIRQLAANPGSLTFPNYVLNRMRQRGFGIDDVSRVLRTGRLKQVTQEEEARRYRMRGATQDEVRLNVVVEIEQDESGLIVVTVFRVKS